MYKVSGNLLEEVVKILDRSDNAINTLERLGSNKRIYDELKRDIQKLSDKIKSQYALDEFTNPNLRNEKLEEQKKKYG